MGLKKIPMKIHDRVRIADDTFEIQFERPADFEYKAGQYISVIIDEDVQDGRGKMRSFSLSSSPNNAEFISTCFRLPSPHSDFKDYIMREPIGIQVSINGPRGKFILPEFTDQEVVMIAGGVGIVPFIGIVRYATEIKSKQKIKLLYTDKSEDRMPYFDELVRLELKNPNFSFVHRFTRVDEDFVLINSDGTKDLYMICGTPGMVEGVKDLLVNMGIKKKSISFENFTGY